MFKCGYCNKEFKSLTERCKCEMECGKKQEDEVRRQKFEKLANIKKDRDEEIFNAAQCLAKQISSYHSDYKETCSAEYPDKYNAVYDYIDVMRALHKLYLS